MMTLDAQVVTENPVHYRIPVYTVALVRERTLSQLQRPQIRTTADAARVLSAYLADTDRENLVVMLLTAATPGPPAVRT